MIAIGMRRDGATRRRPLNGLDVDIHKSEWMKSDQPVAGRSPTVSLIEQVPDSTLCTHFHRQNQFQVFVRGSGTFAGDALHPVTVHYAGAYTGYGPLTSGPDGLDYFTLRPVPEADAFPVQAARDVMIRGPKRHFKSAPIQCLDAVALAELAKPASDDILPAADDGLGVRLYRLPPHTQLDGQVPVQTDGTFAIVLTGSLIYGDIELTQWENLFISADEAFPAVRAGAGGSEVLLLFMPLKAEAYR